MSKTALKAFITSCLFLLIVAAVFPNHPASSSERPLHLRLVWQTDRTLRVPESVIHDGKRNVLYVSNISGKPAEKDGQGFISKVSLTGDIIVLKWITGLNAPKGSGIFNDRLFVADIDEVVEIDIIKGVIVARHRAENALFLNDIAVDSSGRVYISDTSESNSAIYRLQDGRIDLWLRNPKIRRPNGLLVEDEYLVVGNSGDGILKKVHIPSLRITNFAETGSGIDGVTSDGHGNYLISDWKGKISLVSSSGSVTVLLDTTPQRIEAADIVVVPAPEMLLFVPTFFDNRVAAYKILR